MKVASLFSGAGGIELGLPESDTLVLLNDIDESASLVLRQRFPRVTLVRDIADVTGDHLQGADLLTGGFPCQDVSVVGGQRGLDGSKTPLVRHVFRIAAASLPDRILLENVQSIRFVRGGRVLAHLMGEAERLGYSWAYRVLDSRAFGLPQRRRRLFFLASRVDDPGEALLADPGGHLPPSTTDPTRPIGFYWTEGRAGHGLTDDALPTLKSGSGLGIPSTPAVLFPDGTVKVPTIETAERIQGMPLGWTEAAPPRWRWRLVGNAVSPPVVRWIRARMEAPEIWQGNHTSSMPAEGMWPIAAWGDGEGRRLAVTVGEAPSSIQRGLLSAQKFTWHDISERALTGFITRARASNLRYPEGFLDRLDLALARRDPLLPSSVSRKRAR